MTRAVSMLLAFALADYNPLRQLRRMSAQRSGMNDIHTVSTKRAQ